MCKYSQQSRPMFLANLRLVAWPVRKISHYFIAIFFLFLCHSWNHVAVSSHLSWLRQNLLHLIAHMRIHSIFRSLLFDRHSQFDHLAQHTMKLDDNSQWQIPIFKKVTNDPKVVFFFSRFLHFVMCMQHTRWSAIDMRKKCFLWMLWTICPDFLHFFPLNLFLPMKRIIFTDRLKDWLCGTFTRVKKNS